MIFSTLEICRYWNRDPKWFDTLDPNTKILLFAHYRISHEDSKKAKEREKRYNRSKITKAQKNHRWKYGEEDHDE